MALVELPIGKTPYYNIDPVSHNIEMADSCIDGFIDESGSVRRRCGLGEWADTSTGAPGAGIFYWQQIDSLIAVSGGRCFKITANGSVSESEGVIFNNNVVRFADGNRVDGSPWLYMADGGALVYTQNGLSMTRLDPASTGTPESSTHVAWLQSRFLTNDAGTRNFYATDTNPDTGEIEPNYFLASDNPLTAESRPDLLEAIVSSWDELLVWGKQGVEVWRADDVFFSPITGAFSGAGLAAKYSIAEADNTIFALGLVDGTTKRAVIKMEGRTPKVVSLPIEKILNTYSVVEDAIGFMANNSIYVLTFPTEGITWAYDYLRDKWYQWSRWNAFAGQREEFMGRFSATAWGKTFMQSRIDGKIYVFDESTFTDGGNIINTEYLTSFLGHGTGNRKRNSYLQFRLKRGVGGVSDTAYMMLKWRDDGNLEWDANKYRNIDLGTQGNRDMWVKAHQLGQYRSRQYSFSMTDDADLCLVAIEEDVQGLTK